MNERLSHPAINVIIALTFLCIIPLTHLKFDLNIENLFPAHDSDTELYQKFREEFHSDVDDNVLIIGLENSKGIFQKDFLQKTDSLTKYLTRLDHIIKVYSLTNSNFIYFKDDQFNAKPLIRISNEEFYSEDSINLFGSEEFRDLLISKSGKSIAIAAFHAPLLSGKEKEILLHNIQDKINRLGFDKSHLTGKIKIEQVYIKEIKENAIICLFLMVLCGSILIIVFRRSFQFLAILLLITGITIIWSLSLFTLLGYSLDSITCFIPIIPVALCISYFIYFTNHITDILSTGLTKQEALQKTEQNLLPVFILSSCIIAIPFFALMHTEIPAVKIYALFTGIGVLLTCPVTIILLRYFVPRSEGLIRNKSMQTWITFLSSLFIKSIRRRYWILGVFLFLVLLSGFFIIKVEINGRLVEGMSKQSSLWDDYQFIEHDFYGTRRFEMALMVNDSTQSLLNINYLKKIEAIETFLKDSCNLAYLISPISLLKGANKAYKGGSNTFYMLPDTQEEVNEYAENIMQTQYADELQRYLLPDGSKLRISGRLPDLSIKEFNDLRERFDRFFLSQEFGAHFSYLFTGSFLLLDKLPFHLRKNLILAFIILFITILAAGFYLLRTWSVLFICLIPWFSSAFISTGIMSAFDFEFKFETALLFPISLSLGILQMTYFLFRLKPELTKGIILPDAIKRIYVMTGKSIIITNVVLLLCFLSLTISGFVGIRSIGLWVSVNLFFSTLFHFILLPGLLFLLFKNKSIRDINPG